jgi:O-antigen/teichoic acid export membrane protein
MPRASNGLLGLLSKPINDTLLRNSIFLMLSSVANAGIGFLFWMIAAKVYSADELGLATAIISSLSLLILASRFGLDSSLIRFFPERDKERTFGTSISITTLSAMLFAAVFVAGIGFFSPSLSLLATPENFLLFMIFVVANSFIWQLGIAFLALRKANLYLCLNILNGSKILLLFPLIMLGTMGIFTAFGAAMVLTTIICLVLLARLGVKLRLGIDRSFLRESLSFSTSNYLSQLLIWAPTMVLPILVLNFMDSSNAAYYYIAYTIVAILFTVPNAISTSLFVEGSHGEDLKAETRKSVRTTYLVIIPLTILLFVFGGFLLELIGTDYATNAIDLFRIMLLSSFFVAAVQIGISVMRVRNANAHLVIVSGWVFFSLVLSSLALIPVWGLSGIGFAWMLSYGTGSLLLLVLLRREAPLAKKTNA